jgi:hypothetical protein
MIEINYLAVLVAGILATGLGALWYGPLFGKQWIAMTGIQMPETITPEMKKSMNKSYAITFIGALVMAYVLAFSLAMGNAALGTSGIAAGLQAAFWNWLGFVAPVMLGMVLWEGKPWKLYVLNVGYYLASLLLMGTILALWR